jgi:hypothetical protein
MRKKRTVVLALTAILACIVMAANLWSAPPDNFTATMVMGGMSMPMAKMGQKTRVETQMMQNLITINLLDQKKTIMISPGNKSYFEQPMQKDKTPNTMDPNVVVEKKKLGSETIDGHPCIKYDAVVYFKDRPAEKYKTVVWEAQDLGGLPIRNEMDMPEGKKMGGSGKIVTEMKNIKVGAAQASMFEVPRDYKKAGSMQELMGMGKPGNMDQMIKEMKKMKPPKGQE